MKAASIKHLRFGLIVALVSAGCGDSGANTQPRLAIDAAPISEGGGAIAIDGSPRGGEDGPTPDSLALPGTDKGTGAAMDASGDRVIDATVGKDTITVAGTDTCEMFLLAGQSNMEGNVDPALFASLLTELATPPAATRQTRLANSLNNWYDTWNAGYAKYAASPAVASYQAGELVRMQAAGLVGDQLAAPRDDVWCSSEKKGGAATATALQPGKCGNGFGPELALGHYLGAKTTAPISLVKVAQGGSTLEIDWLSPSAALANGAQVGPLYKQLATRIKSLSTDATVLHPACAKRTRAWSAFVWFQGENDTFSSTGGATAYEANLRHFIADVRAEMSAPSLPVVIVQVGFWARTAGKGGPAVHAAQAKVASTTPGASLIVTDDLSHFYHYDPAGQLIIGERIGRVLR